MTETAAEAIHREALDVIARKEAEGLERLQRITAMPTEVDVDAIYDSLQAAFDRLERIAYDIGALHEWGSFGNELEFRITLKDIGVLTVLTSGARQKLEHMTEMVAKVEAGMFSLDCIRREQLARDARRSG